MRVNAFSFFGMESAIILRSEKKNMTGGTLKEWKKMAGVSVWAINWFSKIRTHNTLSLNLR